MPGSEENNWSFATRFFMTQKSLKLKKAFSKKQNRFNNEYNLKSSFLNMAIPAQPGQESSSDETETQSSQNASSSNEIELTVPELYMINNETNEGQKDYEGSSGRIKRVLDSKNNRLLIKIIKYTPNKNPEELLKEYTVLNDLGLSSRFIIRPEERKIYILMPDLGKPLHTYMLAHPELSEDSRFDLAISFCDKVHRLQAGLDSKTHTPYAHLDLKPCNVTVDEHGEVHLVDFGSAQNNPHALITLLPSTHWYLPPKIETSIFAKTWYEFISMDRTLFLPHLFMSQTTPNPLISVREEVTKWSIFNKSFLKRHNLNHMVNTSFSRYPNVTYFIKRKPVSALDHAAIFINRKYQLELSDQLIEQNVGLSLLLLHLHKEKTPRSLIVEIMKEQLDHGSAPYLVSTLPARFSHVSGDTARALFLCAQLDNRIDLDEVAKTPQLQRIITSLAQQGFHRHLHAFITIKSLADAPLAPLTTIINILDNTPQNNPVLREEKINVVLNHPELPDLFKHYNLTPYASIILSSKPLIAYLTSKQEPSASFIATLSHFLKLTISSKRYNELFKDHMDLILALHPKNLSYPTYNDLVHFTKEQIESVRWLNESGLEPALLKSAMKQIIPREPPIDTLVRCRLLRCAENLKQIAQCTTLAKQITELNILQKNLNNVNPEHPITLIDELYLLLQHEALPDERSIGLFQPMMNKILELISKEQAPDINQQFKEKLRLLAITLRNSMVTEPSRVIPGIFNSSNAAGSSESYFETNRPK